MIKSKKILIPFDGSANPARGLDIAIKIAKYSFILVLKL